MTNHLYAGIDLGGTNIKTVLLDASFQGLEQYSFHTEDSHDEPELWKHKIMAHVEGIKKKYPAAKIHVGLAAPGLADENNVMIKHMPGRLKGIENLVWSTILQLPSHVVNDAHAACIGEWKKGAARGKQHVVMITLGTGVGGAIIMDGKLYQGTGGRAGHFGHMTLNYTGATSSTQMVGSLEAAIGNRFVADRTLGHFLSTNDLVKAYQNGDEKGTYWWLDSVNKLACALSSLVNAFSPELIVIGGGISNADDALFKPLQEFMALYEWRPGNQATPIQKAQLGEYAGAIGAAIFASSKQLY